jgi:hypothetical protein
MRSMRIAAVWAAALTAGVSGTAERKVQMKDLPAAVQETVREKTKGMELVGLEEEVDEGKTFYEAETRVNGKTRDILIDSAGVVVEMEEEVSLDSIPAAARAAIVREAGTGKVELVEAVTKEATTVYEAHIKQGGGRTSEVVVAADGTVKKN